MRRHRRDCGQESMMLFTLTLFVLTTYQGWVFEAFSMYVILLT